MEAKVRSHIRGNVVGYVALFFVLTMGTAEALERNAIKSKHIAKNAVKSGDIRNAGVRAADLADGAVTGPKLADDSVDGGKVVNDTLTGDDIVESSLDLETPATPSSLPPSGPAGGDLSGSYPNPQLAASSVGSAEIANGVVTGAKTDASQVQQRVSSTCAAGQFFTAVAQNGTATCTTEPGDISGVTAGTSLTGGGNSGAVTLSVGSGAITTTQVADSSLRMADLSMTNQPDHSVNLGGTINNGACSNTVDEIATGAVANNLTLVYSVRGVGSLGWTIEGEVNPAANEGRYRICNNTGANADPPNLTFSFITIGV